jgi:ferritin-like metal-binding protein YciE
MEEQSSKRSPWLRNNMNREKVRSFFLNHLDRIYTAKRHLIAKLPELATKAHFVDLKMAIDETTVDVEKQLIRMQMIYTLMDAKASSGSINGLSGLIDDAFEAIEEHADDPELRDLSIIFYLQNIESVEMASFQILQMAAVKLENKQVESLLEENYKEARSDRALYLLISSKYMLG